MSAEDFRSAMRILVTTTLFVLLLTGFIGGVAAGCSSNLARSARLDAQRVRDNARTEFYKFCQRKLKAGELPPRGCPR